MRKAAAKKRYLAPDPVYKDPLVTRFVNDMMLSGKKSTSFAILYGAMDVIKETTGEDGYETWKKACSNAMPAVQVKSRRIGGATFQIPTPVREGRKESLAMKWLIGYSRKRNEKTMAQKLAAEVIAAAKEEGAAYKKKEDTLRMAEANKAFSHFRF